MRKLFLAALWAAGCSGAGGDGFMPYPPAADEIQVMAPPVYMIQPGTDVTYCSYLEQTIAAETDVIALRGIQSAGGHHAIVYVGQKPRPVGTHVCTDDDMVNVRYVAGIGADKAAAAFSALPDGLTFRIPANSQIMIQHHWLNATPNVIPVGQAAINLKWRTPSADRVPADLFSVSTVNFTIPAGQVKTVSTTCKMVEDVNLFFLGGHEHEHGTHFTIETVPAVGAATTIYDHDWSPEYVFNPPKNVYSKVAPLTVKTGDSLRVTCTWDNTAGKTDYAFPTEMCVGWGFYFPGHGEYDCVDNHF